MNKLTQLLFLCFLVSAFATILIPISSSDEPILTIDEKVTENLQPELTHEPAQTQLNVTVQMNKNSYTAGENVTIFGTVQDSSGIPIAGATISIEVKDPNNNTIFLDIVFSLPNGTYEDWFRLHEDSILGTYRVYVTASATGYPPAINQTTFTVIEKGFHNIAIIGITYIPQNPVVNQTVTISVTVANLGNFTETFDLNVNYTLRIDPQIGVQTIVLEPGQTAMLNFTWIPNATGRYEIKAYTSTIADDINPSDNTKIVYIHIAATYTSTSSTEEDSWTDIGIRGRRLYYMVSQI